MTAYTGIYPPKKLLSNLSMVATWASSLLLMALCERRLHLSMDWTQMKTCPHTPSQSQQSSIWTADTLHKLASAVHTKHITMDGQYCFPFSLNYSIFPLVITDLVIQVTEHIFEQ
jgi:hypothetical protein